MPRKEARQQTQQPRRKLLRRHAPRRLRQYIEIRHERIPEARSQRIGDCLFRREELIERTNGRAGFRRDFRHGRRFVATFGDDRLRRPQQRDHAQAPALLGRNLGNGTCLM